MLTKISERALVGALYLIGTKILGHPVSVPCRECLQYNNNCIQVQNNGLYARITLDQDDWLNIRLRRKGNDTLHIIMPYDVATCFVEAPVTQVTPYKKTLEMAL